MYLEGKMTYGALNKMHFSSLDYYQLDNLELRSSFLWGDNKIWRFVARFQRISENDQKSPKNKFHKKISASNSKLR